MDYYAVKKNKMEVESGKMKSKIKLCALGWKELPELEHRMLCTVWNTTRIPVHTCTP
jgi:hypothetical protein